MSQQTTLTSYFKSISTPSSSMSEIWSQTTHKRRSLSLKRLTPNKGPAPKQTNKEISMSAKDEEIILLSSDDETAPTKRRNIESNNSGPSAGTSDQTIPNKNDTSINKEDDVKKLSSTPKDMIQCVNSDDSNSDTTFVYSLSPRENLIPAKSCPKSSNEFQSTTNNKKYLSVKRNILSEPTANSQLLNKAAPALDSEEELLKSPYTPQESNEILNSGSNETDSDKSFVLNFTPTDDLTQTTPAKISENPNSNDKFQSSTNTENNLNVTRLSAGTSNTQIHASQTDEEELLKSPCTPQDNNQNSILDVHNSDSDATVVLNLSPLENVSETPTKSCKTKASENSKSSDEFQSPKKEKKYLRVRRNLLPEKTSNSHKSVQQDEEQDLFKSLCTPQENNPSFNSGANNSDSDNNFVYNLSPSDICLTPTTPKKSTKSPRSSGKFYSPNKKRIVKKKSPAKRNLASQFQGSETNTSPKGNTDGKYQDNDTKIEFLLSIIHKCLQTEELKNLVEEESQELLQRCLELPIVGLRLASRLYWRQNTWFILDDLGQIAYGKSKTADTPQLYATISCLVTSDIITPAGNVGEMQMKFDDYVKVLKRPALLQICKELKLKIQSKQDAVEALRAFCKKTPISNFYTGKVKNNHDRVLEMLKLKAGLCYKLTDLARTTFYNLYLLMYLGIDFSLIRDKQLEWALINDKINRERYPIDKDMEVDNASVVFQDRDEFNRYLQAHLLYERYLVTTNVEEKCELVKQSYTLYKDIQEDHMLRHKSLPTWLRRFTPPNIYVKILESGVQDLKKLKQEDSYKLAVEVLDTLIGQLAFREHKRAGWYAEKALIFHNHLESSEKAAKVLLEGFSSDLSEEAKDAMRPRAKKIAKQQNIDLEDSLREALLSYVMQDEILESKFPQEHIHKQPMDNYNQRGKLKFEVYTNDGRSVMSAEDYCVFYYKSTGEFTDGAHWEGNIVKSLFFLLFWDIIYSKPRGVAGVFLTHYQRYPLDMFTESFYLNRKTLIDERLQLIERCSEDMLMTMMVSKQAESSSTELSEIKDISIETLCNIAQCLRPRGVAAICRRLATQYGYCHSGFPDLTLWNVYTKKIKFVEVKTDADKPSVKQLQWLQYLRSHNIDAGFCYIGVNTMRTRARNDPGSSSSA